MRKRIWTDNSKMHNDRQLKPIIPKAGIVFSEKNIFNEIICKPKLLALKSLTLQKLEDMEKKMLYQNQQTTDKDNYNSMF